MLFVISRTRTWDMLINCFKKTDMFCGWYLELDIYKPCTALLVSYTCRVNPTCRSLGAPCRTRWSCHTAPARSSLWTSQCWAKCWRSSWKEQQLSLKAEEISIIPTTIGNPFWSKADCKHTHALSPFDKSWDLTREIPLPTPSRSRVQW